MTPTLRGIFLTSENAEKTARFYREVAELPLEKIGSAGGYIYWKTEEGSIQLAIHDAKAFAEYSYPANIASNLTHLYFKISDQELFVRHLGSLKVDVYARDEVVVTVLDPDGRKVMFGTA